MPTSSEEVWSILKKYLPSLVKELDEGGDLFAALGSAAYALKAGSLSWAGLNQALHRCSQAGMSEGCFRYYFLEVPPNHPYPVTKVLSQTEYRPPGGLTEIASLQQLEWGLCRFVYDAMLYWGNIRQAYRDLRLLSYGEIETLFEGKQINSQRMTTRGKVAEATPIPRDSRYLISEMACKTYEAKEDLRDADHVQLALEGFRALQAERAEVTPKSLREKTKQIAEGRNQQQLFELMFEDAPEVLHTEDEVIALYAGQWAAFQKARVEALQNTRIYLSLCNDLDVYVATSMRTRDDFRDMVRTCQQIFKARKLSKYHIRYFDPTLSAAEHHEDKGIIECLMVRTAKVILYFAQHKESLGKVTAVKDERLLRDWWGRHDWQRVREMPLTQVKDEFVDRFKSELLYRSAKPWPILDYNGRDMYYMIHATDYPDAPGLMHRAYAEAVQPVEPAVQLPLLQALPDATEAN